MSKVVQKAYEHLPNNVSSKLIDLIACNHAIWKRENFTSSEAAEDGTPVRFYKDLANRIMKTEPKKDRQAPHTDACQFHDHADQAEAASCVLPRSRSMMMK